MLAVVIVLAFVSATCDSTPTTPTATGPAITCPPAQTVASATGGSVTVTYPKPTYTGGAAPVTLTCRPDSGTTFPTGTTSVGCTATDANQKSSACSFIVTVTKAPQIAATKFLAFGDSITEGKDGSTCTAVPGASNCTLTTTMNPLERMRALRKMFAELEASPAAYPHVLRDMLASRYTSQTIEMVNEGFGGEVVGDQPGIPGGRTRLHILLTTNPAAMASQVLLLQEGANDMNIATPTASYIEDLRAMVREAKGRGMRVYLGTLLPQRQGGCRAYDYCDGKDDTVVANNAIRSMATAEGATLIDLYPAFSGQTSTLIGFDGLHPTVLGYSKIAETFYGIIRQQLDVP